MLSRTPPTALGEYAGATDLQFETDDGPNRGRLRHAPPGRLAILWVFGAGGGMGGPACGLYQRLGRLLSREGFASLELDYRRPGDLDACMLDVLMGIEYAAAAGYDRVILRRALPSAARWSSMPG